MSPDPIKAMTNSNRDNYTSDQQTSQQSSVQNTINEAIANAIRASQVITEQLKEPMTTVGNTVGDTLHNLVEQSTEAVGKAITPIADNPLIKYATKLPGINWLMAALGQVDEEIVQQEIAVLRQKYPTDTTEQLAQRVMTETAWDAARIGLFTNFLPPLALMLFALDIGAVAALQAKMIYKIAGIYGFAPEDPTRRGEVLAIWGLSTSSSGFLKTGLSFVEIIPGVGAAVGITTDAALIYAVGALACRFYETKLKKSSENI
jgi:uncharacterized protein (DUF697 family)